MNKISFNIKHIKKSAVAFTLAFAMLLSNIVSFPDGGVQASDISRAVSDGDALEREFDSLSAKFGASLNEQMERYLTGDTSGADKAVVETDFTKEGMKSTIRFHLGSFYEYPLVKDLEDAGNQVMRWLNQAIATYPSLCTLLVNCSYTTMVDTGNNRFLQDIKIYSPVDAGEIKRTTASYSRALAELTAVNGQNNTMTEAEKVLLVHDRLALASDYGDVNENSHHTAQAVLLEKKGVCESYTYCFNHAMKRMGISSLSLRSEGHAWNAVRLDGKWYYVDVTWDDPVGDVPISYVGHQFLLVPPSAFADNHTLTSDYNKAYGGILQQMGNAYDNYFPKTKKTYTDESGTLESNITRPLCYLDGTWYYSNRIGVYTWDGKGDEAKPMSDIPSGYPEVCTAVYGSLYYSNPEGLYRYRAGENDTMLVEGNITALALRDGTLHYMKKDASGTETAGTYALTAPEVTPEPVRTAPPEQSELPILRPTPTPPVQTSAPLPTEKPVTPPPVTDEVEAPGRAVIKSLKNHAAGKIKIKVKKTSGASGYQASCSLKKNFKSPTKKISKGTTIQISKRKKKKTYYVRVRAFALDNGTRIYGKWSKTKKVKIKK